jgi:putative methionine-R-sulfoxide reductase with GAF domain
MRLTSALLGLALEAAPDAAAAAATVVDHVGREKRLLPAVYLARGGRLRCAALRGYWQARDGLPGRAGIMGHAYRTGTEIVVQDVAASEHYLEANPGVVAEACFPLRAGGLTVGVLNVESREPLREADLEYLRECARALGARIDELGGLPSESGTQRLLRHVADIADLQDAGAVADALLRAALDLVPLDSALLARTAGPGALRASVAAGPLAGVLRAAPLESVTAWVEDGISLFTVGEPDAPPAASLAELRAAGVEALVAVGLFAHGELLGRARARLRPAGGHGHRRRRAARAARHPRRRVPAHRRADGLAARAR